MKSNVSLDFPLDILDWFSLSLRGSDSLTSWKVLGIWYSRIRVEPYSISWSESTLLGIIIVNRNSEPLFGAELTLISPPSYSHIFLQIDKPTPLLTYWEGLFISLLIGLNTSANCPMVMPGPLSFTATSIN